MPARANTLVKIGGMDRRYSGHTTFRLLKGLRSSVILNLVSELQEMEGCHDISLDTPAASVQSMYDSSNIVCAVNNRDLDSE